MTAFGVRSNHGGDQLKLWIIEPGDQWRARIDFGDLAAEAKVYEPYSGDAEAVDPAGPPAMLLGHRDHRGALASFDGDTAAPFRRNRQPPGAGPLGQEDE